MMNVGVVGLGYWGPNLVRNLYESHLCEQIYCCDLDDAKAEKIKSRYPTIITTRDYKELVQNPEINGTVIATPVSTHFPLAMEFLEAGKHVFVEKPFTPSPEKGAALVAKAEEKGLIVMVGHTFEYSPPVIKIKEIIDSGELGKIYYISASRVNLGLHQKDVSVIWDLAPHDFSCLFYWLGEQPKRLSAMGRDYVLKGVPDVAFINMEFASGCTAHVQVSWLAPSKLRRTAIIGSEKMLVYDDTETMEKVKIYDKGVDYKDPETFGEFQLSYRSGDIISPRLDTFEPLNREMRHFVECCEKGLTPKTDGHNGLRVVKALDAAERSLRAGGKIVEIA
ncbi:gfo/Idh/MocA family oxidoreductase [candidate division KSB1 bacterium]|nr:Gfo/Idh/MocA family oxidoreductase [candidate division KSB1 bacterium]RQW00963.1 MAG: gfo/Idh/MocA family oxidoreductase [candidate division KSB1 bacterium]